MLSKIEFVYKNRFKAGWFTLLKFTKEVKKDPAVKAELTQFSQENTLVKPDTGVIVVKKEARIAKQTSLPRVKLQLQHGIDKEDPEDEKKEETEEARKTPKESKYKASDTRLFLSKITFVHKNRFKSGWFTLLKFMKEVKTNEALREELITFSKENKLDKPETGVVVIVEPVEVKKEKPKPKRPGLTLGGKKPMLMLSHGLDTVDDKVEKRMQEIKENEEVPQPVEEVVQKVEEVLQPVEEVPQIV
jgi:hypothetical protein